MNHAAGDWDSTVAFILSYVPGHELYVLAILECRGLELCKNSRCHVKMGTPQNGDPGSLFSRENGDPGPHTPGKMGTRPGI